MHHRDNGIAKWLVPVLVLCVMLQGGLTKTAGAQVGGAGNDATDAVAAGATKAEPETQPDLAYGAFQRGMYLTAFQLALPRANLGDPAAQTLIAELYDRGLGIARNGKEATAWYGIAAKSGNREAQFSYAIKLLEGKHVAKDRSKARQLMKAAADSGHASAMYNYAQQLIEAYPGVRGLRQALPYLEGAAKNGVGDAYYALSQIYATGAGVTAPNTKEARNWLVLAARSGLDTAQIELAIQLANGTGGDKDERSALAWFQRAALAGNVIAQNRLARMLALGLGTDANPVEAVKWYIVARRAGHVDLWLDDYMDSLSDEMKTKALEAANRLRTR